MTIIGRQSNLAVLVVFLVRLVVLVILDFLESAGWGLYGDTRI